MLVMAHVGVPGMASAGVAVMRCANPAETITRQLNGPPNNTWGAQCQRIDFLSAPQTSHAAPFVTNRHPAGRRDQNTQHDVIHAQAAHRLAGACLNAVRAATSPTQALFHEQAHGKRVGSASTAVQQGGGTPDHLLVQVDVPPKA